MTAREAALAALVKQRRSGIRLDTALAEASKGLSPRDAALASRLCYGVIQKHGLIDLALSPLLSKKTQPQVRDILRLGAYQFWFCDRVPRYALVSEAVTLCKKTAPHAAGMVNAVLQKLPDEPLGTDDLSIRHSLPHWFCERIAGILPLDEQKAFLESSDTVPPVYLHRNPLKPSDAAPGIPHAFVPDCYVLDDPSPMHGLLKSGWGIVADPAAKLAVTAGSPKPGDRLWDTCAAPGGKTLLSAFSMQNKGFILATDKSEDKLPLIKSSLSRCGVTNTTVKQADAAAFAPDGLFDAVLCDVPCSGFGVLRKKPDIRLRKEVGHFPVLQLSILQNASRTVRDGGVLVYCTCTVLPEENEGVIDLFLRDNGSFGLEPFELPGIGETDGMVTLWPHKYDTDGFYICKMRKKD